MKDIYLTNYSVKGIKTLNRLISLSFYKKTVTKELDTQNYNIKGIYGMNGSGKSGIINSVEILKNLLTNPGYLTNPVVQKSLDAMINKELRELYIETDYIVKIESEPLLFRYNITLTKNITGKYVISHECLSSKKATSKKEMETIFEVSSGEISSIYKKENEKLYKEISNKTQNLLETSPMSVLFYEKFILPSLKKSEKNQNVLWASICLLYILGMKLHVYLDESDDHRKYVAQDSLESYGESENYKAEMNLWINSFLERKNDYLDVLTVTKNCVPKVAYAEFEKIIDRLYEFLHIFKTDLQGIEIDKKEKDDFWFCDLIMVYKNYKIHAEFESTGIKKLIRLFAYLKEMVQGGIVFIDEFDSNLHDVYLCALLEYLMDYGEGQLCFTTHNVGPMDVLKHHKKSIDFLSEDKKIYSWTKNGNYSPVTLYKNGMIEGSPFNVDSIDFINAFGPGGEDE